MTRRISVEPPASGTPRYLTEVHCSGLFVYDSSNLSTMVAADPRQGIYIAPAGYPDGSRGAWVRQYDGAVNVLWFGAEGDNVTDDGAAFIAALAYLKAAASSGHGSGLGAARLFIPKGAYYLGTRTLDLDFTLIVEGEGGADASPGSSVLRWAAGTTGIRLQRYNASGATGATGSGTGADGTILRNLWLYGAYTSTEAEAHGIHARCRFRADNVFIALFQGDGVRILATAGGGAGSEGNANNWHMDHVYVQQCRNGFFIDGADVNAGIAIGCNANSNRQAGFYDSAFLSNAYFGCHTDSNGILSGSTTVCSYSGNRYTVKLGQESGASTNAPSGTTANNTWWLYHSAGGPDIGATAWVSGLTWRAGGGYICDAGGGNAFTVFVGCYAESGQPVNQISFPAAEYGGNMQAGAYGSLARPLMFNPYAGDMVAKLDASAEASVSQLQFRRAGTATIYYEHGCQLDGTRNYHLSVGPHQFWTGANYAAAARILDITTSGLELQAGKVVKVNGTQVVGAQGAAVADATDAASAITQLNLALARMRAHGLIAT